MDIFLEKYRLFNLIYREIESLNYRIIIREIELLI